MHTITAWLLTFALHSVVLLSAAWIVERAVAMRTAWRELLWRTALFGGALTATVQIAAEHLPLAGRWQWSEPHAQLIEQPVIVKSAPRALQAVSAPAPVHAENVAAITPVVQAPKLNLPSANWLLALWTIGALGMLSRVALRWRRVHGLFRHAEALHDDELRAAAAMIARRANIDSPQLLTLDSIASPVALHGGRIVLPAWAVASLDRAQLRAMLAHETAHLARHDPAWKALIAIWTALFWFIPTAFVCRRLDDLAELTCDAFAAQQPDDARGLAECLAVCAEHHVGARTFHLVPAMAARPSSLWIRIDRLLEGVTMDTAPSGIGARLVALSSLIACVFALPMIGIEGKHAQAASLNVASTKTHASESSHSSMHNDSRDEKSTMLVTFSDDTRNVMVRVDGKLTLNADETDIATLSDHGTASLEEKQGDVTRRIEVAERNGSLQRRYFVDGTEQPYDDKAHAAMVDLVTELTRSGVGAEERAKRLYTEGGAKRVLDEIPLAHSGYAGNIYMGALLDEGKLTTNDLERAITLSGKFDSDYARHQALSRIIETQPLDAPRQILVLKQLGAMETNYDRAELLVQMAKQLSNDAAVRRAWMSAADGLTTDYDRRRTLEALLAHGGADTAQVTSIIDATSSVESDYDRGKLLKAAVEKAHDGDAIADSYKKSVSSLESDYHRRDALMALIAADQFGPRSADAVLDGAAEIQSDYDRAQVLVALARVMPLDDKYVTRYRKLAANLPKSERNQVEDALVF